MNEKKPDYLVLVNGEHRLPDGFEDTVEIISVENTQGKVIQIEKKTYQAFLQLRKDLWENDGLQAELLSAYRSVASQERIFQRRLAEFGAEYTYKYVALPGHSEHHTGFAIDVSFFVDGKVIRGTENLLSIDHLFQVAHKKLAQYGFILRYPKNKEAVTKIGYEPWHFRYIDSPEIAKNISDAAICFEEYHDTHCKAKV